MAEPHTVATPQARAEFRSDDGYAWALVFYPIAVSIGQSFALKLTLLIALIIVALTRRQLLTAPAVFYLPLALLAGAGSATMLLNSPRQTVLVLLLSVVVLVLATRRVPFTVAVRSLVAGLSVYLLVNIAGWLAGASSPAAKVRTGLYADEASLLGERILFPFTRSINEPAIVAAALIAYVLVEFRQRGRGNLTKLDWVGVVAGAFVIVASGSRFPVGVLIVVVPGLLLLPWLARAVPTLSLAVMAIPFFVAAITPIMNAVAGRIVEIPLLARNQSRDDIVGFSSRGIFWDRGLQYWPQVDSWHQLLGFGYNGHVRSAVVYTYYTDGTFVNNPVALTLHNSFLQQLYDGGYLGLIAMIVALWMIANRFGQLRQKSLLAMVSVLYTTSAIEVFLVPEFLAIPFMLVLALAVISPPLPVSADRDPDGGLDGPDSAATSRYRRAVGRA